MSTHPMAGRLALAEDRRASAPSAIISRTGGTRNKARRPPNGYLCSPEASNVTMAGLSNKNSRSADFRYMEMLPRTKTRAARPVNFNPADELKNPKKLSTNHLKSVTDRGGSGIKFVFQ